MYNSPEYCIYMINGSKRKLYCQCLCLFAKLFLESKSICFAVETFDFFILVENSPEGKTLGFFSRERVSWDGYNLACILIFPPYQKRGLGRLLIAFSYHLSRIHDEITSPEKPLSSYGHASYLQYWTIEVAHTVLKAKRGISIQAISLATSIDQQDVMEALQCMRAIDTNKKAINLDAVEQWIRVQKLSLDPIIDSKYCVAPDDDLV